MQPDEIKITPNKLIEAEDYNACHNLLTEGNLAGSIWSMTAPTALTMLFVASAGLFDVWVAAKITPQAEAAVGMGAMIMVLMTALANAIGIGATAHLSKLWGAEQTDKATAHSRNIIIISIIAGIIVSFCAHPIAHALLNFQTHDTGVLHQAKLYLTPFLFAIVPIYMHLGTNVVFRSAGDARTPFLIAMFNFTTAAILECVFCLTPMRMGMWGIGQAWLIAECASAMLSYLFIIYKLRIPIFGFMLPKLEELKELSASILAIGIPAALQELSWLVSSCLILHLVAKLSQATNIQASWVVGGHLEEMITNTCLFSFMIAARVLIAQNIGAGKVERAIKLGWTMAFSAAAITMLFSTIMFIAAPHLASLLASDAVVAKMSTHYIRILAINEPFVAMWMVLYGCMQGAGQSMIPFLSSMFGMIILRAGLVHILAVHFHMGANGVWYGIACSGIFMGILACVQYRNGFWLKPQS